MSSLIIGVLNVTVDYLVNKGRDFEAQRLKDGDLIDQKLRALFVREINYVKSKLDAWIGKKRSFGSNGLFQGRSCFVR